MRQRITPSVTFTYEATGESKEDMVGKITLYLKQIKEKKITKLQ